MPFSITERTCQLGRKREGKCTTTCSEFIHRQNQSTISLSHISTSRTSSRRRRRTHAHARRRTDAARRTARQQSPADEHGEAPREASQWGDHRSLRCSLIPRLSAAAAADLHAAPTTTDYKFRIMDHLTRE